MIMNHIMSSFVENLGPGQILDREALVAVASGYAKVVVCNNESSMCLFVLDLKNSLEEPSLDIKITIKSYLTRHNEFVKGVDVSREIHGNEKQNISVILFDKTEANNENMKSFENDEILQICIYAWKNSTGRKQCIGYVHIDLTHASTQTFYCVEAWYKIFPLTSFIRGIPVSGIISTTCCIPNPSNFATPLTSISSDVVTALLSLPSQWKYMSASQLCLSIGRNSRKDSIDDSSIFSAESFEKNENRDILGDTYSESSKRYSLRSSSICSSHTCDGWNNNPHHKYRSFSQGSAARFSIVSDQSISKEGTIKEKRNWFRGKLFRKQLKHQRSSRSQEVICDSDVWFSNETCKYFSHDNDPFIEDTQEKCNVPKSSPITEIAEHSPCPEKKKRKKISHFVSWAHSFSKMFKLSSHSSPQDLPLQQNVQSERRYSKNPLDLDYCHEIFSDGDNTYDVLKRFQDMGKTSQVNKEETNEKLNQEKFLISIYNENKENDNNQLINTKLHGQHSNKQPKKSPNNISCYERRRKSGLRQSLAIDEHDEHDKKL